jgi:hypothetical protein
MVGMTIPLSSACLQILGGFPSPYATVYTNATDNTPNYVTGSILLTAWSLPTDAGKGSISLTFTGGATLNGVEEDGTLFGTPIAVSLSGSVSGEIATP